MGYLWYPAGSTERVWKHAEQVTEQIKKASLAEAKRQNCPAQYLASSKTVKKKLAEQIATRDQVESGLICVLSCVEPYLGIFTERGSLAGNQTAGTEVPFAEVPVPLPLLDPSDLRVHERAHRRLWFPFQVQIYLNGREWLAQQMKGKG